MTAAKREVTFTKEQIAAYAEASGDHNPIHLDGAFARSVGLPGIIAHGMLQMGILGCVASDAAGGPDGCGGSTAGLPGWSSRPTR